MNPERLFIEGVKKRRILYVNNGIEDSARVLEEWTKFTNGSSISAKTAQKWWDSLVGRYLDYLQHGTTFEFANDMQFIQPYLMHPVVDSDVEELDEEELQQILNSDKNDNNDDDECEESDSTESNGSKTEGTANTQRDDIQTKSSSLTFDNFTSLELMFLGYAKVLQKMPLQLQLETKRKIFDIMHEAEIKMLQDC